MQKKFKDYDIFNDLKNRSQESEDSSQNKKADLIHRRERKENLMKIK